MKKNKERQEQFMAKIADLCKKFGVKINDYDNYNSDEEYSGTTFYFSGEGIRVELENLQWLINK